MSEQPKPALSEAARLSVLWCRLMHSAPMWPIRGRYQCRICGLSYPVPWAGQNMVPPAGLVIRREARVVESGA